MMGTNSINRLLMKLGYTSAVNKLTDSARTEENVDLVNDLILGQEQIRHRLTERSVIIS